MIEYLREHGGRATIPEIRRAAADRLCQRIPSSSVRRTLRNQHYFGRVKRGGFRLRTGG